MTLQLLNRRQCKGENKTRGEVGGRLAVELNLVFRSGSGYNVGVSMPPYEESIWA